MGNDQSEAIKSKIEKLFKKAESAKELGSLQEAETFMAKAQEILTKYNIEQSELNLGDEQENPVGYEVINMGEAHNWKKTDGRWLIQLYHVVGQHNFCKVVINRTPGTSQVITLIGEDHNRDVVKFMCSNIIPKIRNLEKDRWKEYHGSEKRNAFRRAYLSGAAAGIGAKLSEQRKQDKAKYEGLTGIIVLKDQLVDEKTAEIFGKLKQSRSRRLSANDAGARGYSDGKKVKVDPGVKGGKSSNGPNLLN